MDRRLFALIWAATMVAFTSVSSAAQQKTATQCNQEWAANKAAIQASGKTKKAFVAECRGQPGATAATPPKPAARAAPARSRAATPAGTANLKTAKECNSEWTANKAAIQASKKTKKQFIGECRAQPAGASTATTAPAAPSSARPATPSTAPAAPAPAPRPSSRTEPARTRSTTTAATGAGQFSTEAQARSRCPADTIVWVNLDSKVYHFAGHRSYGNTKSGAYMCERDAMAAGDRAAKNEKHP